MISARRQVLTLAWATLLLTPSLSYAEPSPARQLQLTHLLVNDCGACHGLTMRGGLGLPLTPAAIGDKDSGGLALTILDGRPGTPMPPWRAFLSEDEALWLVSLLKNGHTETGP